MWIYRTLVIFSLLWSLSRACDANQPADLTDVNTQNLLASIDYFTVQLIQKLIFNPQISVNVVLSPMSIYVSLALVLFGSAGDTQTELIAALGFPDADFQLLQQSFRDILSMNDVLRSEIIQSQEYIYVQSHIAEGLFIQQDFSLVKTYARFLNCLNVKPVFVDFVNNMQQASGIISQWIIDNNPSSDSVAVSSGTPPGTTIFITSLFYFTAKWKKNFFSESNTAPAPFFYLNNLQGEAPMMWALTSLYYYDDQKSFTAVEIPYADEYFTAIFILPYAQLDPVQFVTTFTMDLYREFLNNAVLTDVECQIPKFSSTYSLGLKEPLQAMGITQLFENADVSNMLVTNDRKFAAEVTHNAQIVVDETGTTAVALTTIAMVGGGTPPQQYVSFVANHPFLMLVRNTSTNTIAFATFVHRP